MQNLVKVELELKQNKATEPTGGYEEGEFATVYTQAAVIRQVLENILQCETDFYQIILYDTVIKLTTD